jgi:hypothetical protein
VTPTTFHDPADSSLASFAIDMGKINPGDEFSVVLSKARDCVNEALAKMQLNCEAGIQNAAEILREAISFIDEPVVEVSKAASAIREILATIIESENPRLEAECMGLSVGLIFDAASMNQVAQKHGISRQAVSRRVRDYQTEKGIISALYNKRQGSRIGYANSNHRRTKIVPYLKNTTQKIVGV